MIYKTLASNQLYSAQTHRMFEGQSDIVEDCLNAAAIYMVLYYFRNTK